MLINIHYPDNRYDYVKETTLHRMIESGQIMRFKRSSGWVVVGFDNTRTTLRSDNMVEPDDTNKLIRVLYNDNHYDYINSEHLDNLLESSSISRFKRSTGWATVGLDQIRIGRRNKDH